MRLFTSKHFDTMECLFLDQIQDLYDAEKRLTVALPKMAEAAHSPELATAFRTHLSETQTHVNRLEQIFKELGKTPERETCDAMKGLIQEGESVISAKGDANVKDAALIAAAQRVEHYEIAGYGSARNFAERLGHHGAAQLLQQTLDEEGATDKKLTQLAEQLVNPAASAAH